MRKPIIKAVAFAVAFIIGEPSLWADSNVVQALEKLFLQWVVL